MQHFSDDWSCSQRNPHQFKTALVPSGQTGEGRGWDRSGISLVNLKTVLL